jgi:hypothetical protein
VHKSNASKDGWNKDKEALQHHDDVMNEVNAKPTSMIS